MDTMKKLTADDPETKSPDLKAENLAALRALFPELVTEAPNGVAVNLDVLKQLVGDQTVTDAEEKYGLNWHGKRRARQLALTPSTGTLRPCPEDSVDWDTTQNLMIEGDNLEVLKLLQKSYAGKVKLIYIDPPYNTGNDFIYPDNFQDNLKNYLQVTGQAEGGRRISSNTEASGRFHTDWLNMMYPRLKLARNLLREDGVIFISIGDQEASRLRSMLDEIFGDENFIANIVWQKKQSPQNDAINMSDMHDHVIVYARHARQNKGDTLGWQRNKLKRAAGQEARYDNKDNDHRGDWTSADLTCNKTSDERPNLYYAIANPVTKQDVWPSKTRVWAYEPPTMAQLIAEEKLWWGRDGTNMPRLKIFRTDVDDGVVPSTWWSREFAGDNQDARRELRALFPEADVFDTPKPVQLIRRILEIGTSTKACDVVLDFFAGSGTTAHAVGQLNASDGGNRRYVLSQLPEAVADLPFANLAQVTEERLRRAGKKIRDENPAFAGDLGFRVFKLASSNIRAWEPDRDKLADTLEASVEHLKTDRTEQDILFELLLKLGLDLCVPIETKKVEGAKTQAHEIHSIGGGSLLVCLSPAIPQTDVEPLALDLAAWHKQLKPAGETTVVFRDSAFADDVAKTNLTAILHQHDLETVRSL
jgi:adenine-specific DNA-methyltransferase